MLLRTIQYQIWDDDATDTLDTSSSPQPINIMWESGDAAYTEGTQVDEYRTHPAFWWDENSDGVIDEGEQLPGIWVGKFETSHSTIALYQYEPLYEPEVNNLGCVDENCSSADEIIILPNKVALTNNTISNMG